MISVLFSASLLVAGLAAPSVARALAHRGGRWVLTAGSALGAVAMLVITAAPNIAVLGIGFGILGVAMAATLYEPAMAVLVALDPARRARTLAVLTVAGGLASTVYAPLTAVLVEVAGWRVAIATLGVTGGAATALLHRLVPAGATSDVVASIDATELPIRFAHLEVAHVLEVTANLAVTSTFVALVVARGTAPGTAALMLAAMGVGKTVGRLALVGVATERHRITLVTACNIVQFAGLLVPLVAGGAGALLVVSLLVGAAAGATTVLRPLLVADLVGVPRFAATNARLLRSASVPRAAGPAVVGAGASIVGWSATWVLTVALFAVAADRYRRVGAAPADAA
jgi:predicted MFS family arabinose efflux permease